MQYFLLENLQALTVPCNVKDPRQIVFGPADARLHPALPALDILWPEAAKGK